MKFDVKILPWIMLCAYSTKILILGAQFVDAPVLFILASFLAFYEFKSADKKYLELKKELESLNKKIEEVEKKTDENRNYISSMNVAKQMNKFGR